LGVQSRLKLSVLNYLKACRHFLLQ